MLIENSTVTNTVITPTEQTSYRLPIILGTIITLAATIIPLLFIFASNVKPTGSLLSPLPQGEISETTPVPTADPSSLPIVAGANEVAATDSSKTDTAANANRKLITLPTGMNELVVNDKEVSQNSYIYLTPISATNNPVYIKTKGEGYFTIATNKAPTADLLLEYYVVNE